MGAEARMLGAGSRMGKGPERWGLRLASRGGIEAT